MVHIVIQSMFTAAWFSVFFLFFYQKESLQKQDNFITLFSEESIKERGKVKFKKVKLRFDSLQHFLMLFYIENTNNYIQVILSIFYLKPIHFSLMCWLPK